MIGELRTAKEELDKIKAITKATEALQNGGLYEYNKNCKRFELKQQVLFLPGRVEIPIQAYTSLIEAGKQVSNLIKKFKGNKKVKFIVVIEGRAAKYIDVQKQQLNKDLDVWAKELSYGRAMSLYYLWKRNGITLNSENSEVYISGSGFEGMCRYEGIEEDKNKRFIVQIIPHLVEF